MECLLHKHHRWTWCKGEEHNISTKVRSTLPWTLQVNKLSSNSKMIRGAYTEFLTTNLICCYDLWISRCVLLFHIYRSSSVLLQIAGMKWYYYYYFQRHVNMLRDIGLATNNWWQTRQIKMMWKITLQCSHYRRPNSSPKELQK